MNDTHSRLAARTSDVDKAQGLTSHLRRGVQRTPERPLIAEILIGIIAAVFAIAVRLALPFRPEQLPTLTVVIMLAIITTFVGVRAGIVTAVVGGLLAWYFLFNPNSSRLANDAWVPLLGFAVIATVIVSTAHLYRTSERMAHEREMAKLQEQAANAELFASEMAHRLKNALMVVQSIAFQTIGAETPEAAKFASRLRALADANELLNEHVSQPTANAAQVVETALSPFGDAKARIYIDGVSAMIAAREVVSLTLALHELATNALKYGALATPAGHVRLNIAEAGDHLQLTWKELDGPAVTAPQNSGFGTRLLLRSGMDTKLDFEPDGLRCSFGIRKPAES